MRIVQKGIRRPAEAFTFDYEGEAVQAYAGESVAAALLAAGRPVCRETRDGEPRGVFCGMGVCGECAVLIDGQPRRACLHMAEAGLAVTRQPALRPLPEVPGSGAAPAGPWHDSEVDVLVIGAGPAGLSAACAAARCGAQVRLVDERLKAGGQYFKQPGTGFDIDETRIDAQFAEGLALYRHAEAAGVSFSFGTTVWGAWPGPELAIASAAGNEVIRARRVIVSPGAYERPRPFPGWTLPGVMTTGAAQTLLRAYQTAPGRRVLVAGNGPLNLQVARELDAAGAEVVAVAELAAGPSLGTLPQMLQMALTSPGLVLAGIGHTLRLLRSRVPVRYRHAVIEARGDGRVEAVTIAKIDAAGDPVAGSEKHFDVDAVCLGYGFLAQSEIARALGAGHRPIEGSAAPALARDVLGRSAQAPAVFIAGDARGLGGARVAIAQGALAGAEAAKDLGYDPASRGLAGQLRRDRRALARHWRFQEALWALYDAPPPSLAGVDPDTIICRCESVRLGCLRETLAQGVDSLGALKRETRAGMGRCQGRYCAGMLARISSDAGCTATGDDLFFAPRPPFKPMAIGDLAAHFDSSRAFDRSAGAKGPGNTAPAAPAAVTMDNLP